MSASAHMVPETCLRSCFGCAGDEEGRCRGSPGNEEHEGDEGRASTSVQEFKC